MRFSGDDAFKAAEIGLGIIKGYVSVVVNLDSEDAVVWEGSNDGIIEFPLVITVKYKEHAVGTLRYALKLHASVTKSKK